MGGYRAAAAVFGEGAKYLAVVAALRVRRQRVTGDNLVGVYRRPRCSVP